MNVKKLSIRLPEKLVKILDEYAKKEGISRSKAVAKILPSFFNYSESIEKK